MGPLQIRLQRLAASLWTFIEIQQQEVANIGLNTVFTFLGIRDFLSPFALFFTEREVINHTKAASLCRKYRPESESVSKWDL